MHNATDSIMKGAKHAEGWSIVPNHHIAVFQKALGWCAYATPRHC